jgi:hypothetical protein
VGKERLRLPAGFPIILAADFFNVVSTSALLNFRNGCLEAIPLLTMKQLFPHFSSPEAGMTI